MVKPFHGGPVNYNRISPVLLDGRIADSYRGLGYGLPRRPDFIYEASRAEPRARYLETLLTNVDRVIDAALATKDQAVISETRARVAAFWADCAAKSDARFPDDELDPRAEVLAEIETECATHADQIAVAVNPTRSNIERALPGIRREEARTARVRRTFERALHTHHARTA